MMIEGIVPEGIAPYIMPVIVILFFIAIGYSIKFFIDSYVVKWAKKTKTKIDDIIVKGIRTPLILIFTVIGINMALKYASIPSGIKGYVDAGVFVFIVLAVAFSVARILVGLISYYSSTHKGIKSVAPMIQKITQLIVYLIGIMILLDFSGVSITPLLATVGIAGLAVAFALQETLSSLFAGFYIMADRPVRVGDFVKLASGEEGYIVDIGWRSTKIRALANYVIIIPNSKLANSIVTNYYMPEQEMSCLVQVGVSYDSDLEKVEKVTIEVAKNVLESAKGGKKGFEPFIRYHTFSDFSINFSVILRVNEFVDKYLITHEFVKALHKRYREEGIVIPYPIRTVYMKK
ncbi:MAG: mechanosensitive ion channel family protein [Candidatus Thermoplasmatota archaeon]|nr:mechanosensitive ion channel family protein [Candidatus Thermoplasmatota archaeon]